MQQSVRTLLLEINFLLENAEFTKRRLLREYAGVVNNPLSTKLSYSKLKKSVLNPSKSFLALKKSVVGFCRLLKDHSLKNGKNTELTHYPLARR